METTKNGMKRSLSSVALFILSSGITYLYFVWCLLPAITKVLLIKSAKIKITDGLLMIFMLIVAYIFITTCFCFLVRIFKNLKSPEDQGAMGLPIVGLLFSIVFSIVFTFIIGLPLNLFTSSLISFINMLTILLPVFLLITLFFGLKTEFRKKIDP
ncbi:MAG: hypothetical protein NTU81_00475 [Candidatus Nomurabacteria bacterium]|nr:hypothetical protein [Candidatus Nomurabacteria bacterium]